jgi:hypothetical protein
MESMSASELLMEIGRRAGDQANRTMVKYLDPMSDQKVSHSGNVRGAFGEHSSAFREHSRSVQGTFRERSGNIRGAFREHSGSVQGTFGERSGNI